MDLSSIIFITAMLLLVMLFVVWPLSSPRRKADGRSDPRLSGLLAEHDRILDALSDLDNDQLIGKLDPATYADQRARLVSKGAEVLRLLESASETGSLPEAPQPAVKALDDPLEAMIANRRSLRNEPGHSFCGNCGKPVYPSDKFCANCGAEIS